MFLPGTKASPERTPPGDTNGSTNKTEEGEEDSDGDS